MLTIPMSLYLRHVQSFSEHLSGLSITAPIRTETKPHDSLHSRTEVLNTAKVRSVFPRHNMRTDGQAFLARSSFDLHRESND